MTDRTVQQVQLPSGVHLTYELAGPRNGLAIVLLHAWGESRRSFDRLLPLLGQSNRVVALDLPGHGESDNSCSSFSRDALAQDVVAFIDAVGMDTAVLAGSLTL